MALAGRPSRRDGGRRLLVAGMVITLLVVLLDISLKSRSPQTGPRLAAGVWIDRALPLIQASSVQGGTIQQIRSVAPTAVDRSSITSQMTATVKASAATASQLAALRPPSQLAAAAGLLQACLQERAAGVAALSGALSAAFAAPAGENGSGQVAGVANAGQDFLLADKAYQLFAARMPSTGVTPPASTWVIHPENYQTAQVTSYLTTLVNAAAGKLLDQITITNITLNPPALNTNGAVQVLAPTSAVNFSVVVANTGTLTETNFSIFVQINPSAGNAVFKQTIASLAPGAAYNYSYGPLNPKAGVVTTLSAVVQPGGGTGLSTSTKSLQFETATAGGGVPGGSTTTTTGGVG